jgi:hypothetical protein
MAWRVLELSWVRGLEGGLMEASCMLDRNEGDLCEYIN